MTPCAVKLLLDGQPANPKPMKRPSYPSRPATDEQNPFWCPQIPASVYLRHVIAINHNPRRISFARARGVPFNRKLEHGLRHSTTESPVGILESDEDHSFPVKSPSHSPESDSTSKLTDLSLPNHAQRPSPQPLKRKRARPSVTESDSSGSCNLLGPPKRVKSDLTYDSASFVLSDRAEKLHLPTNPSDWTNDRVSLQNNVAVEDDSLQVEREHIEERLLRLEEVLNGGNFSHDTPRSIANLIMKLDKIFPGIRLKKRMLAMDEISHQSLVDFLCQNGLLDLRVLRLFRSTHIYTITLTESMKVTNGLNEGARDTLKAFSLPNSFLSLAKVVLDDVPLSDADMNYLLFLPSLEVISANNTGIGDGAIFRITAHSPTLIALHLSDNPNITDDSIPALMLFGQLQILDLAGTSTTMHGLRRFAVNAVASQPGIQLSIPRSCLEYMDNLNSRYKLEIEPDSTLIVGPEDVVTLSYHALRNNLATHAASNPSIATTGTVGDLQNRLRRILEIRRGDLRLRDMLS